MSDKKKMERYERKLNKELKEFKKKFPDEDTKKYKRAFRNMAKMPLYAFIVVAEVEGIKYANDALLRYSLHGGGAKGAYNIVLKSLMQAV